MAFALLPRSSSSAAMRFRGSSPAPFQLVGVPSGGNGSAGNSGGRQLAKPRAASLVPSRTPRNDSAGSVIGEVAPAALTLVGMRVIDRSGLGKAVQEATGFDASDVIGAGAIALRLTGLDSSMPSVRPQVTRTIQATIFQWAGKVGDGIGDAMDDFDRSQREKAEKVKAEAARAASERPSAKPAEATAQANP